MCNIILNAIFIPIFGYVAGGYTSLVSYLIVMILYFVLARKECIDNEIQMKNYFNTKIANDNTYRYEYCGIVYGCCI